MSESLPHPARSVTVGDYLGTGTADRVLLDAEVSCDYLVPLTVRVNVDTGRVLGVELHLDGFQQSAPGWFTQDKGSLPPQEGDHQITLRQAFIHGHEFADGEHPLADAALAIADRVDVVAEVRSWSLEPEPVVQMGSYQAIWKFPLTWTSTEVSIPEGAEVVLVGGDPGPPDPGTGLAGPAIWALVNPAAKRETRVFTVAGTGHLVNAGSVHVGSYVSAPFVWHVFEEKL